MFVAKRALFITPDVSFAINAKKTLERNGAFEFTSFVDAKDGLAHLKKHECDVALIDFRVGDMMGQRVVQQARSLRPDMTIIVAPETPATRSFAKDNHLFAVIDMPYPMRDLLKLMAEAVRAAHDNDDTQPAPSQQLIPDDEPLTRNYTQTLEFWVADDADSKSDPQIQYPPRSENEDTFQRLAAEEPPMPTFDDGSTIRDLRDTLTDAHNLERVLAALEDLEDEDVYSDTAPAVDVDDFEGDNPALLILETALDQSTPIHTFSLAEFMTRVQEKRLPGEALILPLPSWVEESERYVREPDFLPEELPGFSQPLEYTSATTAPHSLDFIEDDPGNLITDPMVPVRRSHPPEDTPDESPAPPEEISDATSDDADAQLLDADEAAQHAADLERFDEGDISEEVETVEQLPYTDYIDGDRRIAQLALTLTQVSIDLATEATLLARNGEIVAYTGKMPREDIEALRAQVANDWETHEGRTRIRFPMLPQSGKEYLLYSRRTDDGLTLSLIFAGDMPLGKIREQGRRLAEALATVPEVTDEPETTLADTGAVSGATSEVAVATPEPLDQVQPVVEVTERFPATYLWMLADPEATLTPPMRETLYDQLLRRLIRLGWQVATLEVQEDIVYLYAEVPQSDERTPVIDELMLWSAEILRRHMADVDAATLWARSYFTLQPGRELTVPEIQRYIRFVRGN